MEHITTVRIEKTFSAVQRKLEVSGPFLYLQLVREELRGHFLTIDELGSTENVQPGQSRREGSRIR